MYTRAAAEMERVIAKLPQEKVAEARAKISDTIRKGGNIPEPVKEKSSLAKGLAIVTGKAMPSDFRKNSSSTMTPADPAASKSPTTPTPVAVPVSGAKTGTSSSGSNPFGDASPSVPSANPAARPAGAVPPPPPPPASAPPSKGYMVEALYDIEAEAEDELAFKAGDMIEVLETSDDGWWKGRVHGKEGLFPVNYVRT